MKLKKESPATQQKKTGRPLSFDRKEACRKAMLLFWKYGYEGTSLNDLTKSLNVNPSSIYSAFGDKKGLFLAAVAMYSSSPISVEEVISQSSSAKEAASVMLRGAAEMFTGKNTPPGCLLATAAISCSQASFDVQSAIAQIRSNVILSLEGKILEDIKLKKISSKTNASALAQYTIAVIQGMSTMARDGKSRIELLAISEQALNAWGSH